MAVNNAIVQSMLASYERLRANHQARDAFKSENPSLDSIYQTLIHQFASVEEAQQGSNQWSWHDLTALDPQSQVSAVSLFLDHYSEGLLELSQHMPIEDQLLKICEEMAFAAISEEIMPFIRGMLQEGRMDPSQLPLYVAAFYKLSGFISGERKAEVVSYISEFAHIVPGQIPVSSELPFGSVIERRHHFLEAGLQLEATQSYYSKTIQAISRSIEEARVKVDSSIHSLIESMDAFVARLREDFQKGLPAVTLEELQSGAAEAFFKSKYASLIHYMLLLKMLNKSSRYPLSVLKERYRGVLSGLIHEFNILSRLKDLVESLQSQLPVFSSVSDFLESLRVDLLKAFDPSEGFRVGYMWRPYPDWYFQLQDQFHEVDRAAEDLDALNGKLDFRMSQASEESSRLKLTLDYSRDVSDQEFNRGVLSLFQSIGQFAIHPLTQKMELVKIIQHLLLVHKVKLQASLKFSQHVLTQFSRGLRDFNPQLASHFEPRLQDTRSKKELDIRNSGLFPVDTVEEEKESTSEQLLNVSETFRQKNREIGRLRDSIWGKFIAYQDGGKVTVVNALNDELVRFRVLLECNDKVEMIARVERGVRDLSLGELMELFDNIFEELREAFEQERLDETRNLREEEERRVFESREVTGLSEMLGKM